MSGSEKSEQLPPEDYSQNLLFQLLSPIHSPNYLTFGNEIW